MSRYMFSTDAEDDDDDDDDDESLVRPRRACAYVELISNADSTDKVGLLQSTGYFPDALLDIGDVRQTARFLQVAETPFESMTILECRLQRLSHGLASEE